MQAGDEYQFFLLATDLKEQQSQSPVFSIFVELNKLNRTNPIAEKSDYINNDSEQQDKNAE